MKTVAKSLVLFCIVLAFVIVNTILLNNLFSDIKEQLDLLPDTQQSIDNMSRQQRGEYSEILEKIKDKWRSWEQYIYITLNHDVSAEFTDSLLPAAKYFEAGEYSSYLAELSKSKDILKQIKHNEGVSFGTLF